MIFRSELRNSDVLNIFCDASVTSINDIYISAPGYIAVTTDINGYDNIISHGVKILEHSTNNNGEISAISMGIDFAISQKDNFKFINLFSDSKLCIYSLREWIFGWVNNVKPDNNDNYIMMNSSGVPVANQSEIINVVKKIVDNNLNICLYHQSGHVTDTEKSLNAAMKIFIETNYFKRPVSIQDIEYISLYNNNVDQITRDSLIGYQLQHPVLNQAISYQYGPNISMGKYSQLINRHLLR